MLGWKWGGGAGSTLFFGWVCTVEMTGVGKGGVVVESVMAAWKGHGEWLDMYIIRQAIASSTQYTPAISDHD